MIFRYIVVVFSLLAFNDLKRVRFAFPSGLTAFSGDLGHGPGRGLNLGGRFPELTRRKLIEQKYDTDDSERNQQTAKV